MRSMSTPKLPSKMAPKPLKGSPQLQRSLSGELLRSDPKSSLNLSSAKTTMKPSGVKLQTPKAKAKPLLKTPLRPTPKRPLQVVEKPKPVPRVPKIIDRGPIDCCDSLVVETDMGFPCNFCEVRHLFSTHKCCTFYHRYLRISLIEERWLATCKKSTLRSSLLSRATPISLVFSRVPPVPLFFTASLFSAHIRKRTWRLSWVLVTSTSGIICLLGRSRFEVVFTDLFATWRYGLRIQNG